MSPQLALACCTVLVGWFLVLERRAAWSPSAAAWLPIIWMLICGSRSVGSWFGGADASLENVAEAGSPADRAVLGGLIAAGLLVAVKRKTNWRRVCAGNVWLLVMLAYMLASITWSEYPFVSFKRWTRAVGPFVMGVVLLTERERVAAFEAVFRRSAYILIPFSLVLIKYFPSLGVGYGRWDGAQMWTGVTTHKNGLGQLCSVSLVLLMWMVARQPKGLPQRTLRFRFAADCLVISVGLFLLRGPGGVYSATSIVVLAIGALCLLAFRRWPRLAGCVVGRLELSVALMVLMYWLLEPFVVSVVTSAMGRNETLTGRTDIWDLVREAAAKNPILGYGYGGFWGLHPAVTSRVGVEQGHNGYLDVYLELGVVGVLLLAVFLLGTCGQVRRAFLAKSDLGLLATCCLILTLAYNVTESALFTTGFLWNTMVIVIVLVSAAPELPAAAIARSQRRFLSRRSPADDSFAGRGNAAPLQTGAV